MPTDPRDDEFGDAYDEGYAEMQRGIITEEQYQAGCKELDEKRKPVYGMCSNCRSVEVKLNRVDRYTAIEGESDRYPVGFGCEVCD